MFDCRSGSILIIFSLWLQIYAAPIDAFVTTASLPDVSIHTMHNDKIRNQRMQSLQNVASKLNQPRRNPFCGKCMSLLAVPGSNNHQNCHIRNGISSTARESAVIVEWEPVSELERRIDEGMYYQHYIDGEEPIRSKTLKDASGDGSSMQSANGIFCGYKTTKEEVSRLKSANPDDHAV